MSQLFVEIIREQGLRGLFKGAQSPAFGMAALNATLFVSYGQGKSLVSTHGWRKSERTDLAPDLAPWEEFVVGMYAGVFCSLAEVG